MKVNEDITLKLPTSFTNMTDKERIGKYVSSRTPLAMYSSEDRQVDMGININRMQLLPGDEEQIRQFYRGTLETLFDEIAYFQDTIREVNGKKFIIFEFVSTLREENAFSGVRTEKNYTYIQYTSYREQVLLFHFGCKRRGMERWRTAARDMMESVTINR